MARLEAELVAGKYSAENFGVYRDAVRAFQKGFVVETLKQCRGNQCKAAEQLGMHRNSFHRLMTELGVTAKEVKA
jgi:DNA-binding NtrC family response regulator